MVLLHQGILEPALGITPHAVASESNLTYEREIAAGNGEFVNGFAGLLGASEAKRAPLVGFMKQNYAALFPTSQTTSTEMLSSLQKLLSARPELLS